MTIPTNLKKIKEVFTIEHVNTHLGEGWILVAIVPRGSGMGPVYTLGWAGGDDSVRTRQNSADRARGLTS